MEENKTTIKQKTKNPRQNQKKNQKTPNIPPQTSPYCQKNGFHSKFLLDEAVHKISKQYCTLNYN